MKSEIYLSWEKEFDELDLGDERLRRRFLHVLNDFSHQPNASIYESCGGERARMKGAYRLMDHESFEAEKIWSHHRKHTMSRIAQHPVVLLISDTTLFNFESHLNTEGLGRIGKKMRGEGESHGLHCHTVLAVTPEKLPLGILDQLIYARSEKEVGVRKIASGSVPHLEKESRRWSMGLLKSLEGVEELQTNLIAVSDRESDINAYLGTAVEMGIDFIVRGNLARKDHQTMKSVDDFMKSQSPQGHVKLDVIKRNQKTGFRRKPQERLRHAVYRQAQLEVRWQEVQLQVENLFDESRLEKFTCVSVLEKNEQAGGSDHIDWLLLTSLPVKTLEMARTVIDYYSTRWIIEVFHKMLKTGGCDAESCGLQTRERLERYLTMESLVAVLLTQLTYYQRINPGACCEEIVDELTWKTAYCVVKKTKLLPKKPPTAGEFTTMVAQLGGYLNRNSDPYPGGIVLRRGWEKLQDLKVLYDLLKH